MGLQEAADRLVRSYSGGMIRRLEVAQSILHRPQILFLDEPTVCLDPLARSSVWALIRQLCTDYGTTVFLTTHFLDEADALCQRVAIMHQGSVITTGSPTDLKASLNQRDATLDDVFIHYTGDQLATGVSYRELPELDAPLNGWDKPRSQHPLVRGWGAIAELISKTLVITELEVRKLRHDPSDLFLRAVQPTLWLLIFGQVFTRIRGIPTGDLPYLDFMAAGILAQSVLFVSIFSGGMSIIWEKDLGIVHKFLVSA